MFLSKNLRDGIYYLFYSDETGKRRKTSTRTKLKAEAVQFLRTFQKGLKARKKVTLKRFTAEFLDSIKLSHAGKSQILFRLAFTHFQNCIGDPFLSNITGRHIESFTSYLVSKTSSTTANIYFRSLSSAFETAKRWQYIPQNPFKEAVKPRPAQTAPVYFTREQFRKLISVVGDETFKELLYFAVMTGMRRAEILQLQWKDIDLERKLLLVCNSERFTTKTKRSRGLPVNDSLLEMLRLKKANRTSEFIFEKEGRPFNAEYVSKRLKKYVRKAELPESLHFHSLRHSFASWLVEDGVSIYEVQKLLGHQSVSVTQIYAHLQPEQLHNTINRITFLDVNNPAY